jgi:hypothetical protein
MIEEPEDLLYATIEEVLDLFPTSLDLTSPSDEQLPEIVDVLTKVAICTNMWAVHEFGGRLGPSRGNALVEQVVAAAFQTFGGQDPHPHTFEKAAMLLRGITQGHPFMDGNKRTGFLVTLSRTGRLPGARGRATQRGRGRVLSTHIGRGDSGDRGHGSNAGGLLGAAIPVASILFTSGQRIPRLTSPAGRGTVW